MWDNLLISLVIDLSVFLLCTSFLWRYGKLSAYHPATIYLVFHFLIFTVRLFAINSGAALFLSNSSYFLGTENHEISRAAFWADMGFLAMTLAWLVEAQKNEDDFVQTEQGILIDGKVLNIILFVTIPLGIWGIFSQQYIPMLGKSEHDFGDWERSSYLSNTQNFVVLSMMALIFKHGFKKTYLSIVLIFLLILALQGYHRYRVIVPMIFLGSLYLYRNQQKWMPKRYWLIGIFSFLLFLPLKYIGKLVQEGATMEDFSDFFTEYQEVSGDGSNADLAFLDMYAVSMTLVDEAGSYYYGKTFFPILVSPIPRNFWIEKPSLMQWTLDISVPERDISKLGAVCSIYGEAYANFGYFGILLIPFLFARFTARCYFKVLRSPPDSAFVFLYFLLISVLVQVYRDGLVSVFTFIVIYNIPCFLIWLFSVLKGKLFYEKNENHLLDEHSEFSSK